MVRRGPRSRRAGRISSHCTLLPTTCPGLTTSPERRPPAPRPGEMPLIHSHGWVSLECQAPSRPGLELDPGQTALAEALGTVRPWSGGR